MDPQRWRRVDKLFQSALARPPDLRAAYLDDACGEDADLRQELAELLNRNDDTTGIMDRPAWQTVHLEPGQRLGCYEIEELIGAGGMGEVYRATDTRLGRTAAIKVLRPDRNYDPELKNRFLQEARAASALNHPNIVHIYGIETDSGLDFIAMEYVEGKTLNELIGKKGLKTSEALDYAVQIADALSAAHAVNLVHRDIKPSNIMVTGKGLVKLLDFGLAKLVEQSQESGADAHTETMRPLTKDGIVLGTAAYMSPEQAEGKKLDARSDIFSFGAVLYQMVTGRRAFHGDSTARTLAAVLHDEPEAPSQASSKVPRELERIVQRCLRKDLDRRFQHMADVRVALLEVKEEWETGLATKPKVAPARRSPSRVLAAAAFALALLGGGLWLGKEYSSPTPQQTLVPVTTYPGREWTPSFSPDGKQIAFCWDGEKSENNFSVYVKLLGENDALRITTAADSDASPVWSPDGKRIAFLRGGPNGGIYTVSALGGTERKLTGAAGGPMSWSPDGKWLALPFGAPQPIGISLMPVEGGNPRRISNPKSPAFDAFPAFAPDGRRLAYARCASGDSCDVYVTELGPDYSPRGNALQITNQGAMIRGLTWTRDGRALIYSLSGPSAMITYLWRVDADGRHSPQRLDLAGPLAAFPSASPTADRVVFQRVIFDPDIWRYRVNGGAEPLIASSFAIDDNPQFSPDGTRIAFESGRSGDIQEIWVAQADGSKPVQMTNRVGRHQGTPRWSPDGRWIAFDSQGQDGHWGIYVMDPAGTGQRRITPASPFNWSMPFWSRDEKWIYFRSDRTGRPEIWRVPFGGGPQEQVTKEGGYTAYESVDGQTLFYTKGFSGGPLFARRLSGGEEHQVLPYIINKAFFPVADGIYYIGRQASQKSFLVDFLRFSDNTSHLVASIDGLPYQGLSVSPDEKTILFSKSATSGADLMMIENFR